VTRATKRLQAETRTIDYIPRAERHGRLADQASIWFSGSGEVLSFATGIIGITIGLNLGWTLIGLAVGTLLGTALVSAHATQGPHLGLPQMLQSRPQFGRYGSLLIWAVAILVYWGFVISCYNFVEVTGSEVAGLDNYGWVAAAVVIATVLAIYGYDFLHASQRYISYVLIVVLTVFFVGTFLRSGFPYETLNLVGTFDPAKFIVVVTTSLAYSLTWAFFVSDYSRYLPDETSHRSIIAWTSVGVFSGSFFMAAVGSIAAALYPSAGMIPAVWEAANRVFPGFGPALILFGTIALVSYIGMCIYGGALTMISAFDTFRPTRPTPRNRAAVMIVFSAVAAYIGHVLPQEFLTTAFATVLAVAGLFMAPWTAINLTDYFVIRKSRYSILEIFNPKGLYGRWNWRGLTAYFIGFFVMLPFAVFGNYRGALVEYVGGVDISLFIGIPIAGLTYWLLARSQDLTAEKALIAAEDPVLQATGDTRLAAATPAEASAGHDPAPATPA
jgi:nucleobase:cation symporter-1, NCS1 family